MLRDFAIGLAASLVASVVFTVGSYFGLFRPLTARFLREIDHLLHPVDEFTDIRRLCELLRESLASFAGDFSRLKLLRALPCEITTALLEHTGSSAETLSMLGSTPDTARLAVREYDALIDSVVENSVGSFDESVFGRTGVSRIDAATLKSVQRQYLLLDHPPGTSAIGFHPNLNEIGVILIGETESFQHDAVLVWRFGFLLLFSSDFRHIRGFRYKLIPHIANLERIFAQKRADSEREGLFFVTSEASITRVSTMAHEFYSSAP